MRMIIHGGKRLQGHITIMGAKNAALPLIASTLLIKGRVLFQNVPRLTDVIALIDILQSMGAETVWTGERALIIDTKNVDPKRLDKKMMKRLRGSVLLLGPMLSRFKRIYVPEPGGCTIGNRPIDEHLSALAALGAHIEADEDGSLCMETKQLKGSYIVLRFSVTATENLIMAAVLAKGHTSIRLAAAEPHVQSLCRFLQKAGAKIKGIGTHSLEIDGVEQLHAPKTETVVIPDMIEIGTFAAAAALTKGCLELSPIEPSHLDSVFNNLSQVGIQYELTNKKLTVSGSGRLEAFKLQALVYPGFPTDLQAVFGLIATQCRGTSLIHDPLFESRLGYINELIKMGANAVIADPHRVVISGPTPLHGTEIRSLDLRAGATMVLAGLIADGETVIHDAEMVYRGYEALDSRLRAVGADIVCQE